MAMDNVGRGCCGAGGVMGTVDFVFAKKAHKMQNEIEMVTPTHTMTTCMTTPLERGVHGGLA